MTATFSISIPRRAQSPATVDQECCYGRYELALSSGQTQFAASNYLYDINLNAESSLTLNDREGIGISYVYGAKLSPDGTSFFQPSTNGIDVFDGRLGILLNRIALPFSLSANYDALVEDGQDNKLIAITSNQRRRYCRSGSDVSQRAWAITLRCCHPRPTPRKFRIQAAHKAEWGSVRHSRHSACHSLHFAGTSWDRFPCEILIYGAEARVDGWAFAVQSHGD